ncbi:MAG: methyltransferase domain-containing protein, partial [Cyanobacteria bacterium J06636_27]
MDIFQLPIEDNLVDEIFSEHMLEHLSKYEVPQALKEWARVLKPDGKLIMNLPNLEWCLQQWLNQPEEKRWNWQLDTVFGLQTHPGEFHKTGFTKSRLYELLKDAGFNTIKIDDYWSHAQGCFWVEASKYKKEAIANQCSEYQVVPNRKEKSQDRLLSIVVPWWDHTELLNIWEKNLEHLGYTEIIFVDNGSQEKGKLEL